VLSDGRLSGRIGLEEEGDDDSSGVGTDLLPPAPLPLNAWTPLFLSTCCSLLPLPTSFVVPTLSTNFPLLRYFWWWLAMVVGPAQLSFLFSNLSFYYFHAAVSFFQDPSFSCPCC
jgi:hypothetical protein